MKGYKTVVFNTVMAVIALVAAFNPDGEAPTGDDVKRMVDMADVLIAGVWVIGAYIIRGFTDSPMFKDKS